jgi:hypothetical protein
MTAQLAVTCSDCGRTCGRYVIGRNTNRPRCKTCYVRDPNNKETVAKKQTVAAAVRVLEPGLAERAILDCIDKTTTSLYRLRVLARAAAEVPDVFSGSSKTPPIVYHLVSHLIEAGATNIVFPRCSSCGTEAPLTRTSGAERICANCYVHHFRQNDCSVCGRRRIILGHTERGEPLCGTCYARDPSKWNRCDLCGEVNRIITRDEAGAATCQRCYQRPLHVCDGCGERAEIASRRDGKAMCRRCYRRPPRRCGSCGRMRAIRCRASGEDPDLCDACGWARIAVCSRCGHEGRCTGITEGRPVCLRCSLGDAVSQLLTGSDGHIPESLIPVRDMILAVDNARSGEQWVRRSPAATVLRNLATGTLQLTHEALDALPAGTSLTHLRDLLIACGALPERDPYLARLERFIDDKAGSLEDSEDERLLKTFGTWAVLRRVRHRVDNGRPAISAINIGKAHVREAAQFIKWLRQRGTSVADCRQADIDEWLSGGVKTRFRIRPFVTWAVQRRMMQKVSIPKLGKDAAAVPVDLDGRIALARRLLSDDALDPADRFAGALVVIYAQPVTRIVRLKTTDVIESEGNTFIRLGGEALLMPEPLGALVRELPWRRQVGISGQAKPSEWLFPGRQAGRHQHPQHVRKRLARIGIEIRTNRDAALTQLAAEVPASVLADMLGVHVTTATKWADRVSGNWVNYVALKVRDQDPASREESVT